DEAAVHGDAEAVALGDRATPFALFGDQLDHLAQARGVDRITVEGLAVVPHLLHGRLDDARAADQRQQRLLLVAAGRVRDLADHRLYREGARDVRDRAEPANAGERRGFRVLAGDVGDLEWH